MNTTVLIALVKMSVFSAFFILLFLEFPFFQRCFWIGFQKSKITKYLSKKKKTKTRTIKQDAKQKQIKSYDSKQNKTTSRTIKKTKEQLER